MKEIIKVPVMEQISDENDRVSDALRSTLDGRNIFSINVLGSPGAGKTTSIIEIARHLGSRVAVIEGDIQSDIDTVKLESLGITAQQINTQGACHLDAWVIQKAVDSLDLEDGSVLFIENVGNLVCPAEFNIGEHIKLLILTVTEGGDKPYKYPLAFEVADVILLNKCDLLPYTDFDEDYFMKGVRSLNTHAPVFQVSGRQKAGYETVAQWIRQKQSSR